MLLTILYSSVMSSGIKIWPHTGLADEFPGPARLSVACNMKNAVSPASRRNFRGLIFAFTTGYWPCPFIVPELTEDERCPVGEGKMSSAGLKQPSSDQARLVHKTNVWKIPQVEKFMQKFTCSNFHCSYFCVFVMGRENRKNLDLAKISRYTVAVSQLLIIPTHMMRYWLKRVLCTWWLNKTYRTAFFHRDVVHWLLSVFNSKQWSYQVTVRLPNIAIVCNHKNWIFCLLITQPICLVASA